MNFPPMMGQERMKTITDLRSPSITFPASWPANRPNQRKLLEWLLDHDPSARPTADMVLASPLMPMELKSPAEYSKAIASKSWTRRALELIVQLSRPIVAQSHTNSFLTPFSIRHQQAVSISSLSGRQIGCSMTISTPYKKPLKSGRQSS
jgi:serine/threonine protein kinase